MLKSVRSRVPLGGGSHRHRRKPTTASAASALCSLMRRTRR